MGFCFCFVLNMTSVVNGSDNGRDKRSLNGATALYMYGMIISLIRKDIGTYSQRQKHCMEITALNLKILILKKNSSYGKCASFLPFLR